MSSWALKATRKKNHDIVPGSSRFVANELDLLFTEATAQIDRHYKQALDDIDQVKRFTKQVLNGTIDFSLLRSTDASNPYASPIKSASGTRKTPSILTPVPFSVDLPLPRKPLNGTAINTIDKEKLNIQPSGKGNGNGNGNRNGTGIKNGNENVNVKGNENLVEDDPVFEVPVVTKNAENTKSIKGEVIESFKTEPGSSNLTNISKTPSQPHTIGASKPKSVAALIPILHPPQSPHPPKPLKPLKPTQPTQPTQSHVSEAFPKSPHPQYLEKSTSILNVFSVPKTPARYIEPDSDNSFQTIRKTIPNRYKERSSFFRDIELREREQMQKRESQYIKDGQTQHQRSSIFVALPTRESLLSRHEQREVNSFPSSKTSARDITNNSANLDASVNNGANLNPIATASTHHEQQGLSLQKQGMIQSRNVEQIKKDQITDRHIQLDEDTHEEVSVVHEKASFMNEDEEEKEEQREEQKEEGASTLKQMHDPPSFQSSPEKEALFSLVPSRSFTTELQPTLNVWESISRFRSLSPKRLPSPQKQINQQQQQQQQQMQKQKQKQQLKPQKQSPKRPVSPYRLPTLEKTKPNLSVLTNSPKRIRLTPEARLERLTSPTASSAAKDQRRQLKLEGKRERNRFLTTSLKQENFRNGKEGTGEKQNETRSMPKYDYLSLPRSTKKSTTEKRNEAAAVKQRQKLVVKVDHLRKSESEKRFEINQNSVNGVDKNNNDNNKLHVQSHPHPQAQAQSLYPLQTPKKITPHSLPFIASDDDQNQGQILQPWGTSPELRKLAMANKETSPSEFFPSRPKVDLKAVFNRLYHEPQSPAPTPTKQAK